MTEHHGPVENRAQMFLNGTAMSGGADHERISGAIFVGPARTASNYRFYSVRDEFPGLVPSDEGSMIVGEVYAIDDEVWRESLLPSEPSELDPGEIELEDGRRVRAMILDLTRVPDEDLVDITEHGGWRKYLASLPGRAAASRTS